MKTGAVPTWLEASDPGRAIVISPCAGSHSAKSSLSRRTFLQPKTYCWELDKHKMVRPYINKNSDPLSAATSPRSQTKKDTSGNQLNTEKAQSIPDSF